MLWLRTLAFCSLVLPVISAGYAGAPPEVPAGHWSGTLSFRGTDLPMRLEIRPGQGAEPPAVLLDLPDLVMAWEPIPATVEGESLTVTLPFGLGDFALASDGEDALVAESTLAGEPARLRLARADPPPYRREPIRFRSGEIELSGELVLPDGPGPHPAIIMLHGSAQQGRDNWAYRSWADFHARRGVAVLIYDKRDQEQASDLVTLAGDARAAVAWVGDREDIDRTRIGLMGGSQGAWIAADVAAGEQPATVSFLVLTGVAAVSPAQQERQRIESAMRADERPAEQVKAAVQYLDLYFEVARTGEGWPRLAEAIQQAQQAPWGEYVDQPRTLADLAWWRTNADFPVAERLKSLEVPVLAIWGEKDRTTPADPNQRLLESMVDAGRIQTLVAPLADHRLEIPAGRDAQERWRWPQIAPEARQQIAEFVARHTRGN